MRSIAKIVCTGAMLAWVHGATAGEITVRETGGSVILESVPADVTPVPAESIKVAPNQKTPAKTGSTKKASSQNAKPQKAPVAPRVTVKAYKDKVDRARIEKRLEDRSARSKKRSMKAEQGAAERENQRIQQEKAARSKGGNAEE